MRFCNSAIWKALLVQMILPCRSILMGAEANSRQSRCYVDVDGDGSRSPPLWSLILRDVLLYRGSHKLCRDLNCRHSLIVCKSFPKLKPLISPWMLEWFSESLPPLVAFFKPALKELRRTRPYSLIMEIFGRSFCNPFTNVRPGRRFIGAKVMLPPPKFGRDTSANRHLLATPMRMHLLDELLLFIR